MSMVSERGESERVRGRDGVCPFLFLYPSIAKKGHMNKQKNSNSLQIGTSIRIMVIDE